MNNKTPSLSYRHKNIVSLLALLNHDDVIGVMQLIESAELDILGNEVYTDRVVSLYREWEKFINNPYQSTEIIKNLLEKVRMQDATVNYISHVSSEYEVLSKWINELSKFIQNNTGIQELILADINKLSDIIKNSNLVKSSIYGIPETIRMRIEQAKMLFPQDEGFHCQLSEIMDQIPNNSLKSIEEISSIVAKKM